MLINARDPRQWTYLRNLPQKKKKKTLVLTNVGKRAVGGGIWFFFKTRLRTTEIHDNHEYQLWYPPSQTDWPLTDWLTSDRWSKLYRGRLSGPVLPYKICLSVRPSDCPGRFRRRRAEFRFPNPTVRAGSAGGLKRGTVASDGRTHVVNLYIR
jgi:hypothetical protein